MYYVEKLTVFSWIVSIVPEIKRQHKAESALVYYVDASGPGLWLAQAMAKNFKIEIKRLEFTFFDAKDEKGDFLWWIMMFEDLAEVQKYMSQYSALQEIFKSHEAQEHLKLFLMRRILYFNSSPVTLMRILMLFRVARLEHKEPQTINFFLYSYKRPWLSELSKWAATRHVHIIPMRGGHRFSRKEIMMRLDFIKDFLKQAVFVAVGIKQNISKMAQGDQQEASNDSLKIAVEFYGHLNLDYPQLNSDLFFCQTNNSLNKNVLVYFQHPPLPLSDEKWAEIKTHGMSAVVLNPRATSSSRVPLFHYNGKINHEEVFVIHTKDQDDISRDLNTQIVEYYRQKDYWYQFFSKHNIKMHVTWYRSETRYFPMADALQDLGGVSAMYQRSFESDTNPWMVTKADLFFGFSKLGAHLGKDKDSLIPYYVVTGYLGDYRFPLVKKEALQIREQLMSHGANRILAYFDENTADDPRWVEGHNITQENYEFLLKKVLDTPSLGLVLKPKVSSTLRRRLGPVTDLLDRAQASGRCYIFTEGEFHFGSHTPAIAALASDIAIHGHLFGATAGVESALAGVPTLMLDREGCSKSPIYELGEGRVVFRNWNDLWQACQDHWKSGGPGFGDWSAMIEDIDPFRDGRAAERMGTYLEWVRDGLKANLDRDIVLADVAERYAKMWGKDKILAINTSL